MNGRRKTICGYILIETAVALVLLSVGAMTVHRTIQEAIRTRGQAQDYTRVRFLLDQAVADLELQPELIVHAAQGQFVRATRLAAQQEGVGQTGVGDL